MTPDALELLVLTGATYGWAWVLTRSKLTEPVRSALRGVPLLGELSRCVACTGAWCGLALWSLHVHHALAAVVALGWSVFACWALGRLLGDAD